MEMEEIYESIDEVRCESSRSSVNETAPQVSNRSVCGAVVFLGFFCGFLSAGLIGLGVHAAGLSSVKANLTKRLQISDNQISIHMNHLQTCNNQISSLNNRLQASSIQISDLRNVLWTRHMQISDLTEDRDRLNLRLINVSQELERLKAGKTCAKGWKWFSGSCYFLSKDIASWETGRNYCRNNGGDLVIVNSKDEQKFIAGLKRGSWIGLSDREKEGIWKWIDGSPLTLSFWTPGQPNNGANNPVLGQQNCGEITSKGTWNDVSCNNKLHWICEEDP